MSNRFLKGIIAMFAVFVSLTIMTYIGVVFLGYGANPANWNPDHRQGISMFYLCVQMLGAFCAVMAQTDIAYKKQ